MKGQTSVDDWIRFKNKYKSKYKYNVQDLSRFVTIMIRLKIVNGLY